MFNWNYDFAGVALCINCILLFFYKRNHVVPLRQHNYFSGLIYMELLMALTDILSSMALDAGGKAPLFVKYISLSVFFSMYVGCLLLLFLYTKSLCDYHSVRDYPLFSFFYLPAVAVIGLYMTDPLTGLVYFIDPVMGYTAGPLYEVFAALTLYYSFLSLALTAIVHKRMTKDQILTMHIVWAVVIVGALVRLFMPEQLMVSLIMTLCTIIIFINLENPDLYWNRMTGMFNDLSFTEVIQKSLYANKRISVICIGIKNYDEFKMSYDSVAVRLLRKEIAKAMNDIMDCQSIYYLGHGRFAILFIGEEDHLGEAEMAYDRFRRPWIFESDRGRTISVYINASVAYLPPSTNIASGGQLRDVIASKLMDMARQDISGLKIIDEKAMEKQIYISRVEAILDKALELDNIEVWYQPIYDRKTGRIIAAEALSRLHDDQLGYIRPDVFIPLAEITGSITLLGRRVLEKACDFIRRQGLEEMGIEYIEVNLSPAQCRDENLAVKMLEIIEFHGVDPGMINLEVTESTVEDMNQLKQQIRILHDAGVGFSLDDYGVGYSNLVKIFALPFSLVKLDKTVVWSYFNNENQILEDLLAMFQKNGLQVVAEGVETEIMAEKLNELGCDFQQGFWYSEALPDKDFVRYVRDFNGNEK